MAGSHLLTGGDAIQMWQSPEQVVGETDVEVEFYIEDAGEELQLEWRCVWNCRPATPVTQVKFSPDGLLFASIGKVHPDWFIIFGIYRVPTAP